MCSEIRACLNDCFDNKPPVVVFDEILPSNEVIKILVLGPG